MRKSFRMEAFSNKFPSNFVPRNILQLQGRQWKASHNGNLLPRELRQQFIPSFAPTRLCHHAPMLSFKPGSGQKKAEGSLHLICLPVTGDLIPYFFETKKPFFCFLLKKKSMLYFFHLHKIWVRAKIGSVVPNRNLSLAVELRRISPSKLDEIFIIFQFSD